MKVYGNLVDIENRKIFPAEISVENGLIASILPNNQTYSNYILPGFIDAHVHIESSLMVPSEFAKLAVQHGTVGTVSDPHEIANVCGMAGVKFMIENGKQVPFKFFFGAPSCVPATTFETAGASLNAALVDKLLRDDDIWYLSEMMNFPGVLHHDEEVMQKIGSAKKYGKPIDGHAPGLRGSDAENYFKTGISTDHECFTRAEAEEKLKLGVKVIIREGSAARNFDELIPLICDYARQIMFCSDDKHPDGLLVGHINQLVSRAVLAGYDLFDVLQAACINPIKHYKIPVGYLKTGHPADFIVVEDLKSFKVLQTFINGIEVFGNNKTHIPQVEFEPINNFGVKPITVDELNYETDGIQPVIECLDGQLITNKLLLDAGNCLPANDILKLAVVNRYKQAAVATAYIKNFGLKQGAIASSVAHDSHNIIAVGCDETSLVKAINLAIENKGGLCAVSNNRSMILPLPVAGLMSNLDAFEVAKLYTQIDEFAKNELGSTLQAPFMSLSFMALLVIPHLRLSDVGLFDGDNFTFIKSV